MEGSGTILRRTKGYYFLKTVEGLEVECKVKGKLFEKSRFDNQIAVGDYVDFIKSDEKEHGLIKKIHPRKSFLSRARIGVEAEQVIAANVDTLLIIASCKHPPLRTNLINRMVVAAKSGSVTPVLLITKSDLVTDEELKLESEPFIKMGLNVLSSSIFEDSGNTDIRELLKGKISVLSGQSGVGKSSILNKLFPDLKLKVGAISEKTLKGAHTTTYTSMHEVMEDSYVIDTPGIRGFGLWNVNRENLNQYYPFIEDHYDKCHFRGCLHITEPRCSVKEAVEENKIPRNVYQGYLALCESLLHP